jgi:hypothetical protein
MSVNDVINTAQIIAGFAAAGALILTYFTFRSFNKSEETKLAESVFKDIRMLEDQKSKIQKDSVLAHERAEIQESKKDWASLFFNTLEWLSFLINNKKIKDKKIVSYFKPALLAWYNDIFLDVDYIELDQVNDPKDYPELKKLIEDLKSGRFKCL